MLNHSLNHEFRTFCGFVGGVRAIAEALRSSFSGERLPHEYELEIRGIESRLGALLNEFNRMADDFIGSTLIDLDVADRNYQRGVREWREDLDRLLGTVDHALAAFPGTDSQKVRELLGILRRLQQSQVSTLKEILAKWPG